MKRLKLQQDPRAGKFPGLGKTDGGNSNVGTHSMDDTGQRNGSVADRRGGGTVTFSEEPQCQKTNPKPLSLGTSDIQPTLPMQSFTSAFSASGCKPQHSRDAPKPNGTQHKESQSLVKLISSSPWKAVPAITFSSKSYPSRQLWWAHIPSFHLSLCRLQLAKLHRWLISIQ